MQHENAQIAALFEAESPDPFDDRNRYGKIKIRFVLIEDDKLRNIVDGSPLEGLTVSAQYDRDGWYTYGYSVAYRNEWFADLERCEIMVKTLRKVRRGLDRIEKEWGHATDFGTYAIRVCKTLKVKDVYQGNSGKDKTYSTGQYVKWRIQDIVFLTKSSIQNAKTKCTT